MKKEEKMKLKKLYVMIGIIVFIILLIDQVSKALIINYEEITIIPRTLILKVDETNKGSYEDTSRALNILTNLVIVCIIYGIIKSNNQFVTKKTKILLSFAFAGGVSNIIDRIFRGNVIEFINFTNLPAFNIADICIVIGWISFVAMFASFSAKELTHKKYKRNNRVEVSKQKGK